MNLKTLLEDIYFLYFDNELLEMGNMQPRDTGLSSIVHICHKGGAKHGPRVKVSNIAGTFHDKDNFTVTVEHEPRVVGDCKIKKHHLDHIVDWVKLNHDHLHHVWHHGDEMSPSEVENGFIKS